MKNLFAQNDWSLVWELGGSFEFLSCAKEDWRSILYAEEKT